MREEQYDDDGRTIADMSMLDNRSVVSGVVTGLNVSRRRRERQQRKTTDISLDKKERNFYIFGAMGAGLVIGLIFLAVFAIAILLILWIGHVI